LTATRILVVGGKAGIIHKAAELGFDIVHVQKPSAFDPAVVPYCAQLLLVDYQDVSMITALVQALHRHRPVTRIFTQTEAAQQVVGHLTDVLGLPGNGARVTRLLHDKAALRALLNERRIGAVPAVVRPTEDEFRRFVGDHGGAVLKPTMGSGSLGVRKVASIGEVDDAWRWRESFGVEDFMVEKLLIGREVSVESFSVAGRHTVVAVTGKETGGGVVELSHVIPATLTEADHRQVVDLTVAVLDAVGLVDGPAHTELILTVEGPRVVESHSRRGGDRINELVRLVYGVDLEALTYQLAREADPLPGVVPAAGAAAIRFLVADPGVVTTVNGAEDAARAEGVIGVDVQVEAGDTVAPLRWSEDRCGWVVACGPDSATAVRRADEAAGHIVITTVPADAGPTVTMASLLADVDEVLDPFAAPEGALT
jgi:biotin carboxylase